jgi:hypothetical protein
MFLINIQLHAEQPGYVNRVKILAGTSAMAGGASPTGSYIEGIDNSTFSLLCDLLEITAFGDSYKNRKAGLKDGSISISGNYDSADTGQGIIVPGASVYIGVYPSGPSAIGRQAPAICESWELSADAAGKQTITASFQFIGAPVALPLIT